MFLIENHAKAILYTGDIRAEAWWVNSLTRHPKLLPYTIPSPGGRCLDRLYFDTTFAVMQDPYRDFPSKADGLSELFDKIAAYPAATRFYFHAWTFGYEDVWLALSQALKSRVHLDRYRYGMYTALNRTAGGLGLESREAPFLCGFKCGNVMQPGCITNDPGVRLHSCEKGTGCPIFSSQGRTADDVVEIVPIISRHKGVDMAELGAGGGKGDLDQTHELDIAEDPAAVMQLLELCRERIKDRAVLEKVAKMLEASLMEQKRLAFDLPMPSTAAGPKPKDEETIEDDDAPLPLSQIVAILSHLAVSSTPTLSASNPASGVASTTPPNTRPRTITFPYSRHSSYNELRHLVSAFRPADIYPCVAPPVQGWQEADMSMQALFGDCCADVNGVRAWDEEMRAARGQWEEMVRSRARVGRQAGSQREEETESEGEGEERFVAAVEVQMPQRVVVVEEQTTEPLLLQRRQPSGTSASTLFEQQTHANRKRALVDAPHLSPGNRLKTRASAYNAAVQGKWAEAKLLRTDRSEWDSDEEL